MLYIACAVLCLLRFALGAAYDEAAARALLRKEARDVADWHLG